MTITDCLANIQSPPVHALGEGSFESVSELWENFIVPRLPQKEIVLRWHKVLLDYIKRPDAVFPVRGYNSAAPEQYGRLRRGFLTHTNEEYSFFYTDNFHAAYYLKMALKSFVPEVNELIQEYKSRRFPARFGRDTAEERELMAMPRGKNPGFQTAGYLIAHVFEVGQQYYCNGQQYLSLQRDILDVFFPRGSRDDWQIRHDATGDHYVRELNIQPQAKELMVAAFLRFVHPFNYFLMPKRTACTNDISGEQKVLDYVKHKFHELYGKEYDEYLKLIMPDTTDIPPLHDARIQNYSYGQEIGRHPHVLLPIEYDTIEPTRTVDQKTEADCGNGFMQGNIPMPNANIGVGKLAQIILREKLPHIAIEEAERFTTREYSAHKFNLSFPLLARERHPDHTGVYRYYANPVYIGTERFYITSQWYERQRAALIRWGHLH